MKMTTALVTPASGIKGGALVEGLVIAKYLDGCSPLHFNVGQTNQYFPGNTSSTVVNNGTTLALLHSFILSVAGVFHLKALYYVTPYAIN